MVINAELLGLGRIPLAFIILKDSEKASSSLLLLNLFRGYFTFYQSHKDHTSNPDSLRKPCPILKIDGEGELVIC